MKNEDLRIRRTRRLLFRALITLLQKPKATFKKVSVQQICDEAMVHRSTFYMHFHDKYDLFIKGLEKIEGTISIEERRARLKNPFSELAKGDMKEAIDHILLRNQDDAHLMTLFQASIKERIQDDILSLSSENLSSEIPPEIQAEFYAGAIATLHLWWLQNGKHEPVEKMDHYFKLLCK